MSTTDQQQHEKEIEEFFDNIPKTPCPDWCEMTSHAVTKVGAWLEGAISAVLTNLESERQSTLHCDVSYSRAADLLERLLGGATGKRRSHAH